MDELFTIEMDTEGHALTLRFPTVEAADAFKKRVATGVVAASLVAGGAAAGATIATSMTATVEVAAPAQPMVRDTDRYSGRWVPAAEAPAVRDTDRFAGDWAPAAAVPGERSGVHVSPSIGVPAVRYQGHISPSIGMPPAVRQSAPAVRDTDRYSGPWTSAAEAPAARDTDRFDGDWTPGSGTSSSTAGRGPQHAARHAR